MSLMRFGEGRGEAEYVLPTVLSPFALWYILEGDKDCERRKWSHFMIHFGTPQLVIFVCASTVLTTERKKHEKEPITMTCCPSLMTGADCFFQKHRPQPPDTVKSCFSVLSLILLSFSLIFKIGCFQYFIFSLLLCSSSHIHSPHGFFKKILFIGVTVVKKII